MKRTKKFKAHDEHNECRVGDSVRIMETRPLSKDKRWRVAEIIERGILFDSPAEEAEADDPAADNA